MTSTSPVASAAPVAPRTPRPAPKAPAAASYTAPTAHAQTAPADPALVAELAALRAENAALKAGHAPHALSRKVGPSGGVSVYGLGRFPVTLFREQWERLLSDAEVKATLDFIAAHTADLKVKAPRA